MSDAEEGIRVEIYDAQESVPFEMTALRNSYAGLIRNSFH